MADTKISALTASTTPLAGTEVLPIVQSGTTKQVSVANLTAGRDVSVLNLAGTQTVGTSLGSGGVYLSGNGGPDTGFVGYNYKNISGTESVPEAARASWREGFLNGAPVEWNVSYRAAAAAVSSWTKYLVVDSTGNATVSVGNLVIGTSGKGIDFSATSGTGTSELLADYEEGTWTPVVSGTSTAGTYEIGTNGSTYTKVGRTVTVQGFMQFAATVTGGGTGSLQITGLPFSKTANSYPTGSVYLALGTYTGIDPIVVFGSFSASSQLLLQQNASGGYGTSVAIGFASANAYLTFTISYEV